MPSSTRHGGAPPTSGVPGPHGTLRCPATRVCPSRNAQDSSGANRTHARLHTRTATAPQRDGQRSCVLYLSRKGTEEHVFAGHKHARQRPPEQPVLLQGRPLPRRLSTSSQPMHWANGDDVGTAQVSGFICPLTFSPHRCPHQARCRDRIRALTWSPLTESNRRPSPYHLEAWRSLKVVEAGQSVGADRTASAGAGVVAAPWCCTYRSARYCGCLSDCLMIFRLPVVAAAHAIKVAVRRATPDTTQVIKESIET
jgi:hypothetical protein